MEYSLKLYESLKLPLGSCALVVEYGEHQRDAVERISIQPQSPPASSELQDGDVVIAVKATEIVWTDTIMATGQYQHQAKLPYSPGMTYSGVVVWASPKALQEGIRVGESVAIAGDAGPRSLGRHQKWGGCASYAVAPSQAVRKYPPSWTYGQAASFAYGYDTAYHCLIERGQVKQGESILIHGATGGVGIPAVHIAVMMGLTVIATTRSSEKIDFLKSIGVHHVIVLDDKKGFSQAVKNLTKGKGVDVVYDGVGGDQITVESMKALCFDGRLLIVGWAATPNVAKGGGERGSPNANRVPTNLIMMKRLNVLGCPAMISAKHDPSIIPKRAKVISEWLLAGKLPPPTIAETFNLDDVKTALTVRIESGSQTGSTIVVPPPLPLPFQPAKL